LSFIRAKNFTVRKINFFTTVTSLIRRC